MAFSDHSSSHFHFQMVDTCLTHLPCWIKKKPKSFRISINLMSISRNANWKIPTTVFLDLLFSHLYKTVDQYGGVIDGLGWLGLDIVQ